eukprot:EG_transcript_6604
MEVPIWWMGLKSDVQCSSQAPENQPASQLATAGLARPPLRSLMRFASFLSVGLWGGPEMRPCTIWPSFCTAMTPWLSPAAVGGPARFAPAPTHTDGATGIGLPGAVLVSRQVPQTLGRQTLTTVGYSTTASAGLRGGGNQNFSQPTFQPPFATVGQWLQQNDQSIRNNPALMESRGCHLSSCNLCPHICAQRS